MIASSQPTGVPVCCSPCLAIGLPLYLPTVPSHVLDPLMRSPRTPSQMTHPVQSLPPQASQYVCALSFLFLWPHPYYGIKSTDPNDYGLFRRIPDGCDPTTTCVYFVGLQVNANDSAYLDVYLTGQATGWLAIGFSKTKSMVSTETLLLFILNSMLLIPTARQWCCRVQCRK